MPDVGSNKPLGVPARVLSAAKSTVMPLKSTLETGNFLPPRNVVASGFNDQTPARVPYPSGSVYVVFALVTGPWATPSKWTPPLEWIGPNVSVPAPNRISALATTAYFESDGIPSVTVTIRRADGLLIRYPLDLMVAIVEPVTGGVMVNSNLPMTLPVVSLKSWMYGPGAFVPSL